MIVLIVLKSARWHKRCSWTKKGFSCSFSYRQPPSGRLNQQGGTLSETTLNINFNIFININNNIFININIIIKFNISPNMSMNLKVNIDKTTKTDNNMNTSNIMFRYAAGPGEKRNNQVAMDCTRKLWQQWSPEISPDPGNCAPILPRHPVILHHFPSIYDDFHQVQLYSRGQGFRNIG